MAILISNFPALARRLVVLYGKNNGIVGHRVLCVAQEAKPGFLSTRLSPLRHGYLGLCLPEVHILGARPPHRIHQFDDPHSHVLLLHGCSPGTSLSKVHLVEEIHDCDAIDPVLRDDRDPRNWIGAGMPHPKNRICHHGFLDRLFPVPVL